MAGAGWLSQFFCGLLEAIIVPWSGKNMNKTSPISLLISFAGLMGFWLIMSGRYDAFYISLGVLSVVMVMAVNYGLRSYRFYADEADVLLNINYLKLPVYLLWLVWQIVVSGIDVALIILRRSLPISTFIVRFRVDMPGAHARMILGNSITLTPGTLTIDIQGNEFTVHALTPRSVSRVVDGDMPRKVARLFDRKKDVMVYDVRFYSSPEELA